MGRAVYKRGDLFKGIPDNAIIAHLSLVCRICRLKFSQILPIGRERGPEMSLEATKTTIKSYRRPPKAGPYGEYGQASEEAVSTALRLLEIIHKMGLAAPRAVQADGVILKYPREVNVEIGDDGDILVLDGLNHDFSFGADQLDDCATKVAQLCRG